MRLHNTLTGQQEEFRTLQPNQVGMYVCGPTVYEYDHLGHARTYLTFDLLYRLLRYLGNNVTYIQNITDVGHLVNDAETGVDKIQKKARENQQSALEVVEHYTNAHLRDLKALNILQPTKFPRATEHIQEIIDFIGELIRKNFAYVTSYGNVYFSVGRKADYGKLSHRGLAEIITGTRVESAADKRSPADFALWKAGPPGAKEMVWESPWGVGYPGWHIECSAMSRKYLGDSFDIHGSAVEHIFPHHENEIAQTEAATGQPMAHYWVHTGMLFVNSQKMSRSVPSTQVTIQDALKKYSANEIRLAFYLSPYRKPFDYTTASMEQGVALRKKLFSAFAGSLPETGETKVFQEIIDALENDLDTPRALQLWAEEVTKLSRPQTEKLFEIFGLQFKAVEDQPKAEALAKQRDEARQTGDYLTADNRKAELNQLGYEAIDTGDRTIYLPR